VFTYNSCVFDFNDLARSDAVQYALDFCDLLFCLEVPVGRVAIDVHFPFGFGSILYFLDFLVFFWGGVGFNVTEPFLHLCKSPTYIERQACLSHLKVALFQQVLRGHFTCFLLA